MKKNTTNQNIIGKYKILLFGLLVFVIGFSLFSISWNILEKMYMCENHNSQRFLPNSVVSIKCNVIANVGQDLYFRTVFYSHNGADIIKIPAHLQIKDPDDHILYDIDFDDKIVIPINPEKHGVYTATITSLEDPNNRIHRGSTQIWYALGFLTGYDDVPNTLGNAIVLMYVLGNVTFVGGIAVMIFGGIKYFRKND